jgi:TolA-binding protein
MMKKVIFILATVIGVNVLSAQGVADKNLYSNFKVKTTQANLKKAYDANPKDANAIYWYGQSLIAGIEPTKQDLENAKAVYQKALQDGVNEPLIWVGAGHVELLLGGDLNSAKQKFEQAITATLETKGKNKGKPSAAILAAIGRANADGGSKIGDPVYGIEKLKLAATLDLTNPDILISQGISYLKLGNEGFDNGGNAVLAFMEAIKRDSKNAYAMFRLGKVYISQNNPEIFNKYFNDAIAADASFPDTYLALFEYYKFREMSRAKPYIDDFLKYADKDCSSDFYYADYLFRAGKYQESLDKTKAMELGECKTYEKLPILFAYNYDRLGDSVQAKANLDKFFAATAVEKIEPQHYELAVKVYSKFPGSESVAEGYINKAIENDTLSTSRIKFGVLAAEMFNKAKNPKKELEWNLKIKSWRKEETSRGYYFLVESAIKAADTTIAWQVASEYKDKFPDQIYPYRFKVQVAKMMDADTSKGSALPAIQEYVDFLLKDSVKNKISIKQQYYYPAIYYSESNKGNDLNKTLEYLDKILAIDPDDPFATKAKPVVLSVLNKKQQKSGGSKPAGNASPN